MFGILSLVGQNGEDSGDLDRRLLAWLGMSQTPKPAPAALTFDQILADLGLPTRPRAEASPVSPESSSKVENVPRNHDEVAQCVEPDTVVSTSRTADASSGYDMLSGEVGGAVEPPGQQIEPFRDEIPHHWLREQADSEPVPSSMAVATAPATTAAAISSPRARWKSALQVSAAAAGAGAAAVLVLAIRRRFGVLRRLHQLTAQELAGVRKELKDEIGRLQRSIRGNPSAADDMQAHLDKTDRELDRLFAEIDERHRND